jgi:TolB-like protein/Tfp pilus assembly protein PilF
MGVVTAALLIVLGRSLLGGKTGSAKDAAAGRPMLVVLPIQNLGPADDQYFADGLTDEVTNRLGSVSGLGVISRTSALKYAGASRDLHTIGRELSVQYALETTIRTDRGTGNAKQARVSADLIKVGDDTHVWSDRYTVPLTPGQIFDVQAKIAEAVAGALNVVLLEKEKKAVSAKGTDNAEAYDAYLKGSRVVLNFSGAGEPVLREAERQLTRAVTVDSGFAVAYAQLARVQLALFWFGFDRAEAKLPLADVAIRRALALQPDLPEAHLAKGFYHYWGFREFSAALVEFQRVRSERPSDADALAAESFILKRQGKVSEALAAITEAARLDPRAAGYPYFIGLCYITLRQYAQAEQAMRRTLELEPTFSNARFYLGSIMLEQGDTARWRNEIAQLPPDDPGTSAYQVQYYLAVRDYAAALAAANRVPPAFRAQTAFLPRTLLRAQVLALLGNQVAARQNFDSTLTAIKAALAKQLNPTDEAPLQIALALTYAGLGRRDEALRAGLRATVLVPISLDIAAGGEFRLGLAEVQAAVGDPAGAIAGLDSLLKLPVELDVGNLRLEPRWDPLRSNPAFQKLLSRPQ